MLKNKSFIMALLFLTCCEGRGNIAAVRLYRDEIKSKITFQEIVKKYGEGHKKWLDPKSGMVLGYSYSKPHYDLMSFFPFPIANSKFDNYEIILVFDKKNQLIDIKKFHDQLVSLPLAVCEPDLADCDLGYKVIERR